MKIRLALLALMLILLFAAVSSTKSSATPPRTFYASVQHNGALYILGGWDGGSTLYNDVLRSRDGITWEVVTSSAPWQPRTFLRAMSFRGYIYLIGGFLYAPPDNVLGDVWRSKDGAAWERVTADAPWEDREHYGAEVLGDRLYLYGGVTYEDPEPGAWLRAFSDVWSTADGVNWRRETASAPWGPRRGFGSAVLDGQLWVFGGVDSYNVPYNDVWSSPDGAHWTLVAAHAPWAERFAFHAAVFNGRYTILGGETANVQALNDVWSTADGIHWQRLADHAPWEGRVGENPLVLGDSLYLIGGYAGNGMDRIVYHDVWSTQDGALWRLESGSTLTSATCRRYQVHRARCVGE